MKTCAKVVAKGDGESECRLCARYVTFSSPSLLLIGYRKMQTHGERFSSPAMVAITARKTQQPVENLCYACETMLTSANSKSTADVPVPLFPVWALVDDG